MRSETSPKPGVARLLASWVSFTRWTFSSCVDQMRGLEDWMADKVKDAIMDVGAERSAGRNAPGPLPPLEPVALAAALHDEVERTLDRAAEVVNKEPSGCWSPRTEEQVHALFAELAESLLTQALTLRVGAAEARSSDQPSAPDGWVSKYRRMLAEEGRWPAAPQNAEEETPGSDRESV